MIAKKNSKNRLLKLVFGCFFSIMVMFSGLFGALANSPEVVAVPNEGVTTEITEGTSGEVTGEVTTETTDAAGTATGASCEDSLGALGWLVCPTTGKISEAVDWLYEKIEDILVINPVLAEDGQPIYEIWKYFRGVTNIVFIIFLLVVIYSQITGHGISNYGLKRALPKLIVTAVLVNLSFIICSLLVDVSNIVGNGLRGLFESIETATMSSMTLPMDGQSHIAMAEMYSSMAGGTALAIGGGLIAFETGAIWMLIPVALGAIVAVAAGLITIALRQAVVALLIMIAPLAMVSYILPNTEKWFRQWKQLLTRMLVFYPAFSLLFGASSLAGWAIIVSSSDGFGVLLGTAVQIFPLFFSWKLMKMSGTFLETINSGIHRLAAGPLATNRSWADSHRELTKQKNLASSNVYTPTLRLRQYLENRKIARLEETAGHATTVKNRGLEYNARRNYKGGDLDGQLNRRGERAYAEQARNMRYQGAVKIHTVSMDQGYGNRYKVGTVEHARIKALDLENMNAAHELHAIQARAETVEMENAQSYYDRTHAAIDAHMDLDPANLNNPNYKKHFEGSEEERKAALEWYDRMDKIMMGDPLKTQYAAGWAAQARDTQAKIITSKMQKYFEMTPPTADVVARLKEFSLDKNAVGNIDTIIAGMRVLNQRGDTDLVADIMKDVLGITKDGRKVDLDEYIEKMKAVKTLEELEAFKREYEGGIDLGTHASQSLASFLMFDVKDNDSWLRRFGKYINLETAGVFSGRRPSKYSKVTFDEYLRGYYGLDDNGEILFPKKNIDELMKGTNLDKHERTAYDNYNDNLLETYTRRDEEGNVIFRDVKGYVARRKKMRRSIGPQFVTASLSYTSGSEQMMAAIKFDMGYEMKPIDGVLDENGDRVYEYTPIWEKKKGGKYVYNDEEREILQEFYREQAIDDFFARTPAQYLASRTDECVPMGKHLLATYKKFHDDWEGLDDDEMIKRQTMEVLAEKGRLEQLGDMAQKSPGALGGAKSFVLKWAGLDNIAELRRFSEQYKKKKAEEKKISVETEADVVSGAGLYSDADKMRIANEFKKLWEDRTKEERAFYDMAQERLTREFGSESKMAKIYEDHYEELYGGGRTPNEQELYDYLLELLSNPDNYPGAS